LPQIPMQYGIAGGALAVMFLFGLVAYQLMNVVQQRKNSSNGGMGVHPVVLEAMQNSTVAIQNCTKAIENNNEILRPMQTTLGKLCDNTTRQGTQIEELLARARRGGCESH
jgi:hypothetical protein